MTWFDVNPYMCNIIHICIIILTFGPHYNESLSQKRPGQKGRSTVEITNLDTNKTKLLIEFLACVLYFSFICG